MGTPVCWADETDYVNTVSGIDRTHQIDLTTLAAADAWQGAKADLGAARAPSYSVKVSIEFKGGAAPAAGAPVEFYWSSSYSGTAGTGNDGGVEAAGADSDWDGIAGGSTGERSEYKRHLTFMGQLSCGADAGIQVATINQCFVPPTQYGFPIVINGTAVAFMDDAVEMYIALIPNTENVAAS
jgi:hypothetical protein